jgi:hypothetical protein
MSRPAGAICRCPKRRIVLEKSQRLVVRISAPAGEVTLNGILVFEAIGHPAL